MNKNRDSQIVPGISITPSGLATVDPSVSEVLFDLAIQLEEPTNLPVDIEHVLAAIVLAAREGELDSQTTLSANDPALVAKLVGHVQSVFSRFGGQLGSED